MKVWTNIPSLWIITLLLCAGTNGQQVTIATNPNMASYTVGEMLTLTCMVDASIITASGNVSYLWQCSGCFADGWNASNIIRQLTDMDSSAISCLVNSDGVEYMSNMFNLQVTQVPSPGIFFNPPSPILEYVVGDPLTIECMVTTVPGVSTVSIIWTVLGGDIIMNNSRMIITPTNSRGSNFTSNLQFEYLTEGDSNQYTCNVMIQETNASESFGLYGTTVPPPNVTVTAPKNQSVGHPLIIQCVATTVRGVTSGVDFFWSDDYGIFRSTRNVIPTAVNNSQVYTDSYRDSQLRTLDEGRIIRCRAYINRIRGSISGVGNTTLNVTVPTLSVNVTAPNYRILGQPLTLQCEVTTVRGIKGPTYVVIVWSSDDVELKRMGNASISLTPNSLIHRDHYTTPILNTTDIGRVIQCEVEINSSPPVMATDNITLSLTAPSFTVNVTALNTQTPYNAQTVGQSLTLQCEVTTVRGITSRVDIVWSSDGTELERIVGVRRDDILPTALTYIDSYTISQLNTTDDGRVIQCEVVINTSPSVMASDSITLDVTVVVYKPLIQQTGNNPREGNFHNLTCTYTLPDGVSPDLLEIEWSGHRSLTSTGSRVIISTMITGPRQYTRTVSFTEIQPTDSGVYTCTITIIGFDSSFDTINLNVPATSDDSDLTGAIGGGVLGGLFVLAVVLIVVIFLLVWCMRIQRERSANVSHKKSEVIHDTVGTDKSQCAEPNVYSRTPNTTISAQENPAYV